MCGIGALSFSPDSPLDGGLSACLLLAGVSERGEDACGIAWRSRDQVHIHKASLTPTLLLAQMKRQGLLPPQQVRQAIVHVRDYTKGLPTLAANNHPLHHGDAVVVHNGRIQNDEELFALHTRDRAEPGMTVDSEAIAAMLDIHGCDRQLDDQGLLSDQLGLGAALRSLVGSYAFAAFHRSDTGGIFVVRGDGRPLVLAKSPKAGLIFAASTSEAAHFVADALKIRIEINEVPIGWWGLLKDGLLHDEGHFTVTSFAEKPSEGYDPSASQAAREVARDILAGGR